MRKLAITFLTLICVGCSTLANDEQTLKRNPEYSDRLSKEVEKIYVLNQKFKSPDVLKECAKGEVVSDCYLKQLQALHAKEKLSPTAFTLAIPTGIDLVLVEKEQLRKATGKGTAKSTAKSTAKMSNSQISHVSHKKQAQLGIKILEMMCTQAKAQDWGFKDPDIVKLDEKVAKESLENIEKAVREDIEQTRKYSSLDGAALTVDFEQAVACRKNK